MKVSYGTKLYNPTIESVEFGWIIDLIRHDRRLKRLIENIRTEENKDRRRKLKENLPFFNMGEFKEMLINDHFVRTAHMLYDFDKLDSEEKIVDLRRVLEADSSVLAVFVSPSGAGLKVVCPLPVEVTDVDEYRAQWIYYSRLAQEKWGVENDKQTKDVRRLCFLSSDSAAYFNENAEPLPPAPEAELEEIRRQYQGTGGALVSPASGAGSASSPLPPYIFQTAATCHGNEAPEYEKIADACDAIAGKINDYNDWLKIGLALAGELGEKGRNLFIHVSHNPTFWNTNPNPIKFLNSKYNNFLKSPKRTHIETLFYLAHSMGWKPKKYSKPQGTDDIPIQAEKKDRKFWYLKFGSTAAGDRLEIPPVSFLAFLHDNGFGKFWWDDSRYVLIRVTNNIVTEMNPARIKDFISQYTKSLPEKADEVSHEKRDGVRVIHRAEILESLMNSRLFTEGQLEFLDPIEVEFLRDEKHLSRLFYQNCYIEITMDHIKIRDYSNLKRKIWKSQRINREIDRNLFEKIVQENTSEFGTFCQNITGRDEDRYRALISGIGYMLHTYKNRARAKCVIWMDEQINDMGEGQSGGTGKSLLGTGIGYIRNCKRIDARNLDMKDKFRFQEITPATEIIDFNDCSKTTDFGKLFGIITDDITIEKKGQGAFTIPFHASQKIMLSTNFVISNMDQSSQRRQFVVEFANYYSPDNTPVDEFGHLLFDEWDATEWLRFDVFMMKCIKFHLRHGFYIYQQINVMEKNLILSTSQEFVQSCDDMLASQQILTDTWYAKTVMMERLKVASGFEKIGNVKIGKWFKTWAKCRGFNYSEERHDEWDPNSERRQTRGFIISKPSVDDDAPLVV